MQTDGVLFADWKVEGDNLVRRVQQDTRHILEFNSEIRKNPDALRSLEWGALALQIPELHYWRLVKKYPDLIAKHAHTKTQAWMKFLNSSESAPYRYHDRSRARGA